MQHRKSDLSVFKYINIIYRQIPSKTGSAGRQDIIIGHDKKI